MQIMKRNLKYLTKALSTAVLRRVLREALGKLQEMLWTDVLMRQSFTTYGAAQFTRDVRAVCSLVERYVVDGSSVLRNLSEAVQLLSLPVEDEDEDEDEVQAAPENGQESGRGAGRMSLKRASNKIFTDNTEAKAMLLELGIETLTPANARNILQRRVEDCE